MVLTEDVGKDVAFPIIGTHINNLYFRYATLIGERLTLTFAVRMTVGKALVIASRYALNRR